ncbi:response regulator [Paenibacillus sp. BAC0078]
MWNLLVVEDESIVRMGLRYMLDWEACGVNWKAEASNGEEALEILESGDIHIIMTDIRMPGMNGLELVQQLRTNGDYRTAVIFLSSYDDFPYVKEAIRLGAIDYLHKPTMDEAEVTATLRKTIALLEQSAVRPQTLLTEKERNEQLVSLLDIYTFPHEPVYEKLLGEPFKQGLWLAAFRLRDDAADQIGATTEEDNMKFMSIRYLIDEYVAKDWGGHVFHRNHREIIWLAPAQAKDERKVPTDKEYYLDKMRNKIFELLNVFLIYSSSQIYSGPSEIPHAYFEAELKFPAHQQSDSLYVRMAKQFVDRYLLEDISLPKVAESIPISTSYLSRIFLKEVGESFSEYVIRNKIMYAQKLLRETNKKIYEIAEQLSYTNPHYFGKLFKERVGMTPLEYRNR